MPRRVPGPVTEGGLLASHIPEDKIAEIRHAVDIAEIISESVLLRKAGKNLVGLCPFHSEKTPSFTVSPDKQIFHCFGCGAGGNVFTFLMQHDKVSFLEAVRTLAERAGIALPADDAATQAQANEYEALYNACRAAAHFFYDMLTRSPEGKNGMAYFRGRGFTDETMKKFGLGYSLPGWDTFLRHGEGEGIPAVVLERGREIRARTGRV